MNPCHVSTLEEKEPLESERLGETADVENEWILGSWVEMQMAVRSDSKGEALVVGLNV